MTDNEIIKALECCFLPSVSDTCPRKRKDILCNDGCERMLVTDALDLINRQKAEIERLDKLVIYNASCCTRLHKDLFNAKSETIKEFAERLKEKRDGGTYPYVLINVIDNLVKEMTEPVKIEHNSLCETETYKGE